MKMLICPSLFGVMICFEKLMTTRNERGQRKNLQKREKKEKKGSLKMADIILHTDNF